MHVVLCGYQRAPDCSNAQFSDLKFTSSLQNGKLTYRSKNGSCKIAIELRNKNIATVTQVKYCDEFLFWGPHGIYTREEQSVVSSSCDEP